MASYSLSLGRGQSEFQITEGTAAPGAGSVELRVNLADFTTVGGSGFNNEVQVIMDMFKNWIAGRSSTIV